MPDTVSKGRDPEPTLDEDIEYWKDRFRELASEAKHAGYSVVYCLSGYNPLEGETGESLMVYGRAGDYYACYGTLKATLDAF